MRLRSPTDLTRADDAPDSGTVTFPELFFDLVFVFAITQISQLLVEHYDVRGAAQATLLLLAAWWVWIYSAWVLNWFDPQTIQARTMIYVLMLLGLFASMAIPEAFGARGLVFALSFVAVHIGRCLFALWSLAGQSPHLHRNLVRITLWLAFSGVLWICGALLDPGPRLGVWALALAIEYAGPLLAFRTPGLGRSSPAAWAIDGRHIAERCGLFVIICLGETLVISAASFANAVWTRPGTLAFLIDFIGTVTMWWVYFRNGLGRGDRAVGTAADPGRNARIAYTYAHIPIVAGIVLSAVAAAQVIARPEAVAGWPAAASILGGPALFFLGNAWFKKLTAGSTPLTHVAGLALLAGLATVAPLLSMLALNALSVAVLLLVAILERAQFGVRRASQDRARS